jgi:hypothetical protein
VPTKRSATIPANGARDDRVRRGLAREIHAGARGFQRAVRLLRDVLRELVLLPRACTCVSFWSYSAFETTF